MISTLSALHWYNIHTIVVSMDLSYHWCKIAGTDCGAGLQLDLPLSFRLETITQLSHDDSVEQA